MKKSYLFGMLALAAMTMVGCSNDEVVNDYSQDNAIEFGTYVGRGAQSRTEVINTENLKTFGVFAFYRDNGADAGNTPDFMNNQMVEKIEVDENTSLIYKTSWKYTPAKYWPNEKNDVIDFYAYAPWMESRIWNEKLIDIEINNVVTDQTDYLVADPVLGQGKQAVDDNVNFTFSHVLSRVGFKVEAVIDEVNHQNNGAKDEDKENQDFYDKNTVVSVQEVELIGQFYKKAKLNLETGVISDYSETNTSYKLETGNFVEKVANDVTIKAEGLLNNEQSYLMFIPQNLPIKIRVKYTVKTKDDNLFTNGGYSIVENNITSDEFNFDFQKGHAYNFVLHLGLTSVKLSASVEKWADDENIVVNVPINFKKQN